MDDSLPGELLLDELPLGESLVDKARRLRGMAGEAIAMRDAMQDAKRLGKRTEELRTAMAAPASAAPTWQACARAGVPNLQVPDNAGLTSVVIDVRRRLDAGERPPDADFEAIRRGLVALARRTEDAVAQAWQPFARAKAVSAGIASVRALPPATREPLKPTVAAVERAMSTPPANPAQVDAFIRNIAVLEREVEQARIRDLPAPLKVVFDRLGDTGFPLRELTPEQLRLLQENGLDGVLVLRWAE